MIALACFLLPGTFGRLGTEFLRPFSILLLFLGVGAIVWTVFGVSKALKDVEKSGRVISVIVASFLIVFLSIASFTLGVHLGWSIVPNSARELALIQESVNAERIEQSARSQDREDERNQELAEAAREQAENPPPSESAPLTLQQWRTDMASKGWISAETGVWFKIADEGYSCGDATCQYIWVTVEESCYSGVVLNISRMGDNDISLGRDDQMTGALVKGGSEYPIARVDLFDYSFQTLWWNVTSAYCAD